MTPERKALLHETIKKLERIRRSCQEHDEPYAPNLIVILTEVLEELLRGMLEEM